jgi:hypothetical protein
MVNWGRWSETGMAYPLVIILLKRQGIVQISPVKGREFFLNELRSGNAEKVEVVAGDEPWKKNKGHRRPKKEIFKQ